MRTFLGKQVRLAVALATIVSAACFAEAKSDTHLPLRQGDIASIDPTLPTRSQRLVRVGEELAQEMRCLAKNIYFEARSEAMIGQLAVAMVTLNRVASDRFPNSICDVVRQGGTKQRHRCQFSWYCDGKADRPDNTKAWRRAQYMAFRALFHQVGDPTDGALWYHADYVKPRWTQRLRRTNRIGRHLYYGES